MSVDSSTPSRPVLVTGRGSVHPRGRYLAGHTTRQRILQAACTRLHAAGLSGVTVRAVARQAGISTAGLLHHFRSRDTLLAGLVAAEARSALTSRLGSSPALAPATGRLYLGILADGGRGLPLSYSLTLRLRRLVRAHLPRSGETLPLPAIDGAILAALVGDTSPLTTFRLTALLPTTLDGDHASAHHHRRNGPLLHARPVRLGELACRPPPLPLHPAPARLGHQVEQIEIPAQRFRMGDSRGDGRRGDGETPVHPVSLAGFSIDATSVTNADFARFVAATSYRTDAERFGSSAVFHLALAAPDDDIVGAATGTPWWVAVNGADWAHPGGRDATVRDLQDHPVVHISWNDAQAYCDWADRALPTEAQWEAASRGGLDGARYPWGDERDEDRMNIWQGTFPVENTMADGYLTTAPVRSYRPNAYGLWQTVGNVWEWCADWWDPRYYAVSPERDPRGPTTGRGRVLRGGSYLCHDSYCNRYRNAARSSNTPDSSMGNAGFRTVARADG